MGIFGVSEEQKRVAEEAQARRDDVIRKAWGQSSSDARLQALATVYAAGGQLDGSISSWDRNRADDAMQDFVALMLSKD